MWNARYVNLLAIESALQFATYMLNPVVAGYAVSMGASLAEGGFVAGLVALSALAARPLTGWIADCLNKAMLLIAAAAFFVISSLGCVWVPSVWLMGVLRVVQGLAFALRSAVVVSLVSTVVDRGYIGRAVGCIGAAQMAACALAPSVSACMGDYHDIFLVAGQLYLGGFLLSVAFYLSQRRLIDDGQLKTHKQSKLRCGVAKIGFVYRPSLRFSVMAALSGVPHAINVSLILTVGEAEGISNIAIYFTAYAIAALLARPVAGRISDTKGCRAVVMPALLIDLVGVACLTVMHSLLLVVLAGAFVGVGQGTAYSALQAESVRNVPVDCLGRASNTFYIGPDTNMGVTPFVAGFVMSSWGVMTMYLACFALLAFSTLCFAIISHKGAK